MAKNVGDWGGPWTEKKLEAFSKYVWSYLTILKQTHWKTIYFDGFAGSGERKSGNPESEALYKQLKLTEEEESVYKGAAERVLTIDEGLLFNFYYFVEASQQSLDKLKAKLETLENSKRTRLEFKLGDCNKWLAELATAMQNPKYAALVLLDPFGMQINWSSIAASKEPDPMSGYWFQLEL